MEDDLQNIDMDELLKRAAKEERQRLARHRLLLANGSSWPDGYGKADFDYATKLAYWNDEEFAAYSLDKDPIIINQQECNAWINVHAFCDLYCKRLDVIRRAIQVGRLSQHPSPLEAVEWAVECRMLLPFPLFEFLDLHGHTVIDWNHAYASLAEAHGRLQSEHGRLSQDYNATAQELRQTLAAMQQQNQDWSDWSALAMQQIRQLSSRVQEAEAENRDLRENNSELINAQNSLHPKERTSLLKLTYILARRGYGWVPSSPIPMSEIINDGASFGVRIDEGTVRKYLNLAHEEFGNSEAER